MSAADVRARTGSSAHSVRGAPSARGDHSAGSDSDAVRGLARGSSRAKHRSGALDAVRAIAAIMVVGVHANVLVGDGDSGGLIHALRYHLWSGVDLFFALSGFLIAGPFLRALANGTPLPNSASYGLRRVTRIVPAYWVALTIFLLTAAPTGTTAGSALGHYALIHDWIPGQSRALYPVAWTLGIEALFYLLVPIGAGWVRSRRPGPIPTQLLLRGIAGIAAVALAWDLLWGFAFDHVGVLERHYAAHSVIVDNLPAALILFCPGLALAVLTMPSPANPAGGLRPSGGLWGFVQRLPAMMLLAVAGLLWAFGSFLGRGNENRPTTVLSVLRDEVFVAVAAGLVLLVFVRGGRRVRAFSRFAAPFGVISYGIYLWQWPAVQWINGIHIQLGHSRTFDWLVAFALLLVVTLPLALLSWVLVERPLIGWATRRSAPSAPATRARRAHGEARLESAQVPVDAMPPARPHRTTVRTFPAGTAAEPTRR